MSQLEILETIREGSRTVVRRARLDGKTVIVKTPRENYADWGDLNRLKHEYEILRDLNEPGVIKAFDFREQGTVPALILEDIGGESLAGRKEAVPPAEFLPMAEKIVAALGALHRRNIIHRDIKPHNIIHNKSDDELRIIDFGNATLLSRENPAIRNANAMEGTLAYISPELTGRMNRAVDYRTDLYSLGVTFFQLLTGRLPFDSSDKMELVHCHIARSAPDAREINDAVPEVLGAIVAKLLSKTPEARYQSAAGLGSDLRECRERLSTTGRIDLFDIAQADASEKFEVDQKLHGREKEIETLLSAFEDIRGGRSEMLTVAGYSGVGKSALVNEIHKPITARRGFFIAGKFDQFKRDIPYNALILAFRDQVKQLLVESRESLEIWKERLLQALGENGRIITDVIPEVELILGVQPAVQQLGPEESRYRFNIVFKNFLRAFARKEHPCVVFLDDMQWSDSSTLQLVREIVRDPESRNLLWICSYRDNEVDDAHIFMRTLREIEEGGGRIRRIVLGPLSESHVNQIAEASLKCEPAIVAPLAGLVYEKTRGNPFFVNEFLKTLYQESRLNFDAESRRWTWDLEEIRKADITDNVVELMTGRMQNLPEATRRVLRLASCVGNRFELGVLATVNEKTRAATARELEDALREGLVVPVDDAYKYIIETSADDDLLKATYRFLHDRVQQAAYSLIPELTRNETHLRIARHLLRDISREELEERVFEIVNHANKGAALMESDEERIEMARMNALAGAKARSAAAFEPCAGYLLTGLEILPAGAWQKDYSLTLELYTNAADALNLTSRLDESDKLVKVVLEQARTPLDRVGAYEVSIRSHNNRNNIPDAIETARAALAELGVRTPAKPGQTDIVLALLKTKVIMAWKGAESILDAPMMTDPEKTAAMRILVLIGSSTYQSDFDTFAVMVMTMVWITYRYGNTPEAPYGLSLYATAHAGVLKLYDQAYDLGRLALRLQERLDFRSVQCKTIMVHNVFVRHWTEPIENTLNALMVGAQAGIESGDIEFHGYCHFFHNEAVFWFRSELHSIRSDIIVVHDRQKAFAQEQSLNVMKIRLQFVDCLLGNAPDVKRLKGEFLEPDEMEEKLRTTKYRSGMVYMYHAQALLSWLFGDKKHAREQMNLAREQEIGIIAQAILPVFEMHDALIRIACLPDSTRKEQAVERKKIKAALKLLGKWARRMPDHCAHRYYIVRAEQARYRGEDDALDFYERAIEGAEKSGFALDAATFNELAGRYVLEFDEPAARTYLRDAYLAYKRWGCEPAVEALANEFEWLPRRRDHRASTHATTTSSSETTDDLDFGTVIKASQALSGEIQVSNLIRTMMTIMVENAGADTGVLILVDKDQLLVEARVDAETGAVELMDSVAMSEYGNLPRSIIHYAQRTRTDVVLNDAAAEGMFTNDPYIRTARPRSVLCAPIINRGETRGMVYLENNLSPGAFTDDRLQVLRSLSTQAAISIDNARLYTNLEEQVRERTVDLTRTLDEARRLKEIQDGDYYLTSLLVEPLGGNNSRSEIIEIETLLRQKTRFKFRRWDTEIGGDLNITYDVILRNQPCTVFMNMDAMGKSIQGAGGTLVVGAVFKAIIERTRVSTVMKDQTPAEWLRGIFLDMHGVFESFAGSMMISAALGIVEDSTGYMHYILAEHPRMVLYRGEGTAVFLDNREVYGKLGMPLLQPDEVIPEGLALAPGDVIIAGTDGRDELVLGKDEDGTNIINEEEALFLDCVNEGGGNPERILEAIEKRGEIRDDIALLRLQYNGTGGDIHGPIVEARRLAASGDYKTAAAELNAIAAARPSDGHTWFLLSFCLRKLSRLKEATDAGEKARLLLPNSTRNLMNLADIYARSGNPVRADELLSRAEELAPGDARIEKSRRLIASRLNQGAE